MEVKRPVRGTLQNVQFHGLPLSGLWEKRKGKKSVCGINGRKDWLSFSILICLSIFISFCCSFALAKILKQNSETTDQDNSTPQWLLLYKLSPGTFRVAEQMDLSCNCISALDEKRPN